MPFDPTVLSWWIPVDKPTDLRSALQHFRDDQLEYRILTLMLAMTTKSTSLPMREEPVTSSPSIDYSGINIYMYRPRLIYIDTEHKDFQDDHLLILLTDGPTEPQAKRDDFATHLLDNLRTDEFCITDERAHRSQNPSRAKPLGVKGVTKMWSEHSTEAHKVNVEFFSWSPPWRDGVMANVQQMEDASMQLPGQAERIVLLGLEENGGRTGRGLTSYEVLYPGQSGAEFVTERY